MEKGKDVFIHFDVFCLFHQGINELIETCVLVTIVTGEGDDNFPKRNYCLMKYGI